VREKGKLAQYLGEDIGKKLALLGVEGEIILK